VKRAACIISALALAACDGADTGESGTKPPVERSELPDANTLNERASYPATSACAETEGTIFSCKIRDGRTIAVCVQRDEQGREYAQYRFGQDDELPELAWPTSFDESGMQWASVPYSGGGEAQLSFLRGDIRYVIYSRVIRTNFSPGEANDPVFDDGAHVYRGARRISSLPCAGEAARPVSVAMAERLAEQQDDLFTD
jgi:hypothetical protein